MADREHLGRRTGVGRIGAAAAAATVCAVIPHLPRNAGDYAADPPALAWLWWTLIFCAAPVVAYVRSVRRPVVTSFVQGFLAGVWQVPLAFALALLDTWLEVRSGYLLANSGEEAMAYGIGGIVSVIVGFVLALAVAAAARLGTAAARRRARRRASTGSRPS